MGFKLRITAVGSNHSADCTAPTIAQPMEPARHGYLYVKINLGRWGGTLRNGAKNAEINDGEEDAFRFMSSTHKLS